MPQISLLFLALSYLGARIEQLFLDKKIKTKVPCLGNVSDSTKCQPKA